MLLPAIALAAGFALGAPSLDRRPAGLPPGQAHADLALRVAAPATQEGAAPPAGLRFAAGPSGEGPPACSGDVCQPLISVPGFEPRYSRSSRQELAVSLLGRVNLGPLTRLVWAVVSTGLSLDYTPPALDLTSPHPHGWGSVVVRFRVRIGADGAPTFQARPE